jgi:hypothetical protein
MVSRHDYGRDFPERPKRPVWKRALRAFGLALGCLLLLAWTTADKESFEKVGVPIVGIGALLMACRQDTRACPQLGDIFTRTDQNQTRNAVL